MRRFLFRCYGYALRQTLRARTIALRGFERQDPTRILLDHRTERQLQAEAALVPAPARPSAPRRLLVLVPFRDRWDLTQVCLTTLRQQELDGIHLTVVLIDNGSTEPATAAGLQALREHWPHERMGLRHLRLDMPFNFSRLNNLAFEQCQDESPDFVLLLNNDVEMIERDGVQRLVSFLDANTSVGAVGCTLLFPDRTIQHSFIAPGVKIVGAHPLKGLPYDARYEWLQAPRVVAGVTGAALLVRSQVYREVGGFEEDLPTAYQDVDFCLKLLERGYCNVTVPGVVMVHHETATRRSNLQPDEIRWMYRRWGGFLVNNPYYSEKFSRWSERPVYAIGEGEYPIRCFI